MTTLPVDHLVDPEFGLVTGLHPVARLDGLPPSYVGLTAEVADSRVHGNWPSDRVSLGTTFGDPAGARIAAIGEAVERYCGNHVPDGLLRGTARELTAAGHRLLGPDHLRFFADWQHERAGFPFARFTDDVEIAWVAGEGDDGPVLVPASWAHLNWRTGSRRGDAFLHHVNYAGIATGQGVDDAVRRGLLELVERDALSLWWHLDLPAAGIDPDSVPGLREHLAGSRLEVHLLALPAWFGVPVVAAVVHDPVTGIVAGGFSAKLDPAETAVKATLEAIHSWVFTQGLLQADGWVFEAIGAGILSEGLYLPHRPDRDYLAVAGEQCSRVRDLGAQAQVWLDPEVQRRLLPRFTEPPTTVGLDALPAGTEPGLRAALRAAGHEVVVCDLTTPDVALTPLRVVRVCARGLVPNAPAAFPYYGLPRWADVAGRPPTPESLLLLPPPSL
ncbi:YcaO-like family protein [Nocardioides lianchengensis]|uniref:Ribosomal protein S12 methylthiotransferase accessory factor n=1 Tax=Nocardioides lianchengensis TaxID=1045774 RepID=A0A1G6W064_9ACTN|nr:YcaO-like family protein [Nocardioides lianchengensis]NYG09491.1 ribosomal protein S12 methylthiotransferase accessory factor [Nocardioides lianchengensis]SDD59174.1 ribosomal protein S12 methylthiotransferase accessory factor [Nocardioides lianchengensis]